MVPTSPFEPTATQLVGVAQEILESNREEVGSCTVHPGVDCALALLGTMKPVVASTATTRNARAAERARWITRLRLGRRIRPFSLLQIGADIFPPKRKLVSDGGGIVAGSALLVVN